MALRFKVVFKADPCQTLESQTIKSPDLHSTLVAILSSFVFGNLLTLWEPSTNLVGPLPFVVSSKYKKKLKEYDGCTPHTLKLLNEYDQIEIYISLFYMNILQKIFGKVSIF